MDRTVLLQEPEVSLADHELSIEGSHYALGEIESAEVHREPAAATGPILMIVVGLVCLFSVGGRAGVTGAILGVGLLVGAAIWWTQKKPSFQVCVSTQTGETTPFESRNEEEAARVLAAIQQARSLPGSSTR